jgi:hypothetical protein
METQYAVPCEACFFSKEYTAAKEMIFTTLLKEPLAKLLAWSKKSKRFRGCIHCKLYRYSNFSWRKHHTDTHHMFSSLFLTNIGTEILIISMCTLPH